MPRQTPNLKKARKKKRKNKLSFHGITTAPRNGCRFLSLRDSYTYTSSAQVYVNGRAA